MYGVFLVIKFMCVDSKWINFAFIVIVIDVESSTMNVFHMTFFSSFKRVSCLLITHRLFIFLCTIHVHLKFHLF